MSSYTRFRYFHKCAYILVMNAFMGTLTKLKVEKDDKGKVPVLFPSYMNW